jgi:hypothetical protein
VTDVIADREIVDVELDVPLPPRVQQVAEILAEARARRILEAHKAPDPEVQP